MVADVAARLGELTGQVGLEDVGRPPDQVRTFGQLDHRVNIH
ncbi:MAG TPA: hypothetical protein VIM10_00220 [Actinopolymorphaceae bacterium]